MRRTVTQCVSSWAACRSSILHELSGGLDSSIVLACLAAAPSKPRVTCCTHVTDSPEGDERYYAHLMARHAHVPLTELPLRPRAWNCIEELVRVLHRIAAIHSISVQRRSEIRDLVAAGSVDCTFSGQGGDHLFLRTLPRITAADFAWVHGLSLPLCRVIAETAHASRRSIWSIGRKPSDTATFAAHTTSGRDRGWQASYAHLLLMSHSHVIRGSTAAQSCHPQSSCR